MTRPKISGNSGETAAEFLLSREGFTIVGRQVPAAGGHKCDLAVLHPDTGDECLVEVKSWGATPGGQDTVKKAIADAYDLREAGETRPYILVLTHHLGGLLGEMIKRARRCGVIYECRIMNTRSNYDS